MAIRFEPPKGVHTFFLGGPQVFKKADAMAKLKGWSIYDNGVEVYFVENFGFKGGDMRINVYFAKDEGHVISFDVHEIFPDEHKVIKKEKDMDNSHFTSQIHSEDSMLVKSLNERIEALVANVMELNKENSELRNRLVTETHRCNRFRDALIGLKSSIDNLVTEKPDEG